MQWRLLDTLEPADRAAIEEQMAPRSFKRGEVIFHAGDPGESLHLITSGLVVIRISSAQGDELTLNVLRAGDYVGELALIRADRERTATAAALEATTTRVLTRAAFDRARTGRPAVDHFLLEMMADRVAALGERLIEALYEPVDRRCARRLLEIAPADGDGTCVIPLTQEELSNLVGSTRPSVNQALRKFEDRGWLSIARGRVELLDVKALAKWAER